MVSGTVVIIVETTSLLVLPGAILIGCGAYGFLTRARARRAGSTTGEARGPPRDRESAIEGG